MELEELDLSQAPVEVRIRDFAIQSLSDEERTFLLRKISYYLEVDGSTWTTGEFSEALADVIANRPQRPSEGQNFTARHVLEDTIRNVHDVRGPLGVPSE